MEELLMRYLRRTCDQTTITEEARLVGGRFVNFVSQRGHWKSISLLKHGLWAFLGTHLEFHAVFILCLSVMHDECLLADRSFFESLHCLLVNVTMEAFWSRLHVGTEGWVEIFYSTDFFCSRCIFLRINLNRWLPLELSRSLCGEVRSRSRGKERMRLIQTGYWAWSVLLVRRKLLRCGAWPFAGCSSLHFKLC